MCFCLETTYRFCTQHCYSPLRQSHPFFSSNLTAQSLSVSILCVCHSLELPVCFDMHTTPQPPDVETPVVIRTVGYCISNSQYVASVCRIQQLISFCPSFDSTLGATKYLSLSFSAVDMPLSSCLQYRVLLGRILLLSVVSSALTRHRLFNLCKICS